MFQLSRALAVASSRLTQVGGHNPSPARQIILLELRLTLLTSAALAALPSHTIA